jgi:DNA-binding CsgD family transcriptional regulator
MIDHRCSSRRRRLPRLLSNWLCGTYATSRSPRRWGISEPTIRTYLQRISARTQTRGRMELAMRVLAVSHQVAREA